MSALQVAIGTLNDIVDAPSDAGHKPGKPLPAGVVSMAAARAMVVIAAAVGVVLGFVLGGPGLLGLGVVVLAIGAAYDLAAKGTPLSWLPFAVGIPILPIYGWLGGTGAAPGWFAILLPAGFLAGMGLAIANARADVERDRAAGRSSVAVWLGLTRSWWVSVAALGTALVMALGWAPRLLSIPLVLVALVGITLVAAGSVIGRRSSPAARERAWQLQAVGVAVLAVGWIAAVVG